ncbi:MAG TPA: Holliday junction branch migration protein RuvA [Jatrophihabitantaceae bacterium]|jgi:Holliday junction DNA helicase RuvA|nr:Holliday junction branch migration protein RuvA [Jatrophihabitantaceae bacterium]
MIASVHGRVAALGPGGVVVEVGGVGLAVSCSPGTLARLRVGEPARLATSLVVREDSLTLYGFADDDERALFELLQTAAGVGPKLAQTMLAVHPPRELRRAIATDDLTTLIKVPGIGRKGAERIVLELRDRIGAIDGSDSAYEAGVSAVAPWRDQLAHALAGLGFTGKEAEGAIDVVAAEFAESNAAGEPAAELSVLLRRSIQLLGRTR